MWTTRIKTAFLRKVYWTVVNWCYSNKGKEKPTIRSILESCLWSFKLTFWLRDFHIHAEHNGCGDCLHRSTMSWFLPYKVDRARHANCVCISSVSLSAAVGYQVNRLWMWRTRSPFPLAAAEQVCRVKSSALVHFQKSWKNRSDWRRFLKLTRHESEICAVTNKNPHRNVFVHNTCIEHFWRKEQENVHFFALLLSRTDKQHI